MRELRFWLVVALMVALASSGALAAATMWLSLDELGTPITSDVSVQPGADITLYCFMSSAAEGNTFEIMVGYDRSSVPDGGYGAGSPTDFMDGKLALSPVSTQSAIRDSIDPTFNVIRTTDGGIYAGVAVVLNASGREDNNQQLVPPDKPFGFAVREAKSTNTAPGTVKCFSFTLRNQMTEPSDSQYVVLSNKPGGASYSDAWKHGTTLHEASSYIKIVNAGSKPAVGASNRAIFDAVAMGAIPNYIWVLWGTVNDRTTNSFRLDDGSGVTITVNATGHGMLNGRYVAVRGTLSNVNPGTKTATLTSTAGDITPYTP